MHESHTHLFSYDYFVCFNLSLRFAFHVLSSDTGTDGKEECLFNAQVSQTHITFFFYKCILP